MQLDQDRIRAILNDEHSYYGRGDIPIRVDDRWHPKWQNIIAPQLSPTMRILDVGCGSGRFLLETSPRFFSGLGVDHDPDHIDLAQEAKRAEGVSNVDFLLLEYPDGIKQLQPESFDMVVSLRGPVPGTDENIQAAHSLLRPEGLLYCEEIAEEHQKEVTEIFSDHFPKKSTVRKVVELREALERNGFDIRLAADIFTKWIYPDVYAWMQYICNLWTWLDIPLPEPDDPRIHLFAERNMNAAGETVTTHHVAWVAGVKK
jgi:SAM-dependent methyltransferase